MGGREFFAVTLAIAGAVLASIGIELWFSLRAEERDIEPISVIGRRYLVDGRFPPEVRPAAMRLMATGLAIFVLALPAVALGH
jgi:hypothetical protein